MGGVDHTRISAIGSTYSVSTSWVQYMLYEGCVLTDEQMDEMRNSGIVRPHPFERMRSRLALAACRRLSSSTLSPTSAWNVISPRLVAVCRRFSRADQQSAQQARGGRKDGGRRVGQIS
jgi:hypothetical protein